MRCDDCGGDGVGVRLEDSELCDRCADHRIAVATGWPELPPAPRGEILVGPDREQHVFNYRLFRWPGRVVAVAKKGQPMARPAIGWRLVSITRRILQSWAIAFAGRPVWQSANPISNATRSPAGGACPAMRWLAILSRLTIPIPTRRSLSTGLRISISTSPASVLLSGLGDRYGKRRARASAARALDSSLGG